MNSMVAGWLQLSWAKQKLPSSPARSLIARLGHTGPGGMARNSDASAGTTSGFACSWYGL